MRWKIIFGLAGLVTVLDQVTKHLVITSLSRDEVIQLTAFLNLVSVRNRGAAFGFLSDPAINWQFWFFAAATIVALAIICFMARSAESGDRMFFFSLGLLMGGAVGNLIDRVRFREVVDFLDFHYAGLHWPAFNVADVAICLGAVGVAWCVLRPGRRGVSADHGPPAVSKREGG